MLLVLGGFVAVSAVVVAVALLKKGLVCCFLLVLNVPFAQVVDLSGPVVADLSHPAGASRSSRDDGRALLESVLSLPP